VTRGAGAYPLTRERVQRLQEVEKKRRQASIEKKGIGLLLFFPLITKAKRWHCSLL
jgi:hypothetical protein